MQENILEMAKTNENILLELKANEYYDYNEYEDFSKLLYDYEIILEDISQPNIEE